MKKKPERVLTPFERSFLAMAHHVQPIAFRNVLRGDDIEYQIRSIQRWFSNEFHKDIDEVEDMDTYKLLLHFFERRYEMMEELDREETHKKLIETDEEREARLAEEEGQVDKQMQADEDLLRMVKKTADQYRKLEDTPAQAKKAINNFAESIEKLGEKVSEMTAIGEEDKEGFSFQYISEEDMEKKIAEFDMAILSDKPKK